MGVYIKDMEMPTRCGRCDMCIKEADGDIDYHYECCITAARIGNLGEKMEDCPLVPVPAHGRLIDADAFIVDQCNNCDGDCEKVDCDCLNCDKDCRCDYIINLAEAPTIIPAEEGET